AGGGVRRASTTPARPRAWYERAFGVTADADGFLRLGQVGLLVDGREDVAAGAAEPTRVILNLHVEDAQATARHLDVMSVTWLAPLEDREPAAAWFRTLAHPAGHHPPSV